MFCYDLLVTNYHLKRDKNVLWPNEQTEISVVFGFFFLSFPTNQDTTEANSTVEINVSLSSNLQLKCEACLAYELPYRIAFFLHCLLHDDLWLLSLITQLWIPWLLPVPGCGSLNQTLSRWETCKSKAQNCSEVRK